MTEPRPTASTINDNQLDELYAERDRARHALRHLLRHLPRYAETEEEHVDRTPPDSVRQLVDALADALPAWDPAEERDFVWRHYQLTHRVLTRRVAQAEERAENFEGRAKAMEQRAEQAGAVTAETKKLLQRRTTTLRQRAERAEAVVESVRALAEAHPVGIDTALIHEALPEPPTHACTYGERCPNCRD
ncbi:hypothetical protein ACFWOL_15420 [Streptomyces sp. NPDC058442]|uniref:hypothetical protein n=1 Tax=Streptomyces sp. NPDC058442 TaxID=3346503 RepID=UPI00364D0D96